MQYSKIPLAQTVIALCKTHKIKHIVISPGSRSAPLTIGFTHDNFFECYSIVDERCAAFFALGIAQQTQQPVALVCTSGSALLNYYPAISEAFYSNIPLVVLSADRPEHMVDIGDGQTIKQKNVYGGHVHYSANLKLGLQKEYGKDIQTYNEAEINKALYESGSKSGPVHVNVPFAEPLYETVDTLSIIPSANALPEVIEIIDNEELEKSAAIWKNAKRKLILVGVLQPNSVEKKWLDELARDESVIVFTETTSNLHHPEFFPSIDKIIAPLGNEGFKALQPDILLTFGGMIVSKKIKAFLREYQPRHHWHLDLYNANDTFFCMEKHFKVRPNTFFAKFLSKTNFSTKSNYKSHWLDLRHRRRAMHEKYLESIPFSDFLVFDRVLKSIPTKSQLQVGNSSAIRYTQLFQLKKDVKVFCNRGTSGIDGSTSTAIGASVVSKERITFITGDLSFFYDSNAFWNSYIPKSFRIIVINNAGGGIFRILPGHKNTRNFDTYFETKHGLTAEKICEMFDVEYLKASTLDQLIDHLSNFYKDSKRPKLLEVFTPSSLNDEILLKYFEYIK